uniref:Uncharacterized protein n=1 Tax=Anguilla anguilla TaxID=7936 RepID=A0A0E9TRU1_ANGAN
MGTRYEQTPGHPVPAEVVHDGISGSYHPAHRSFPQQRHSRAWCSISMQLDRR